MKLRCYIAVDSFFDEPEELRSKPATVDYLAAIAGARGLDIVGATGNPTDGGIRSKTLLARVDEVTWSALGSLNGGEVSHKINREG